MVRLKSRAVALLVAISLFSIPTVVIPNRAEAIVGTATLDPAGIIVGTIMVALGVEGYQSLRSPTAAILALPFAFLFTLSGLILLPADSAHGYQPTLEFTPIPLEQRIRAGISRPEYATYMMERALLNSVIQQVQAELPADSEINRQTLGDAAQRIEELRLDAGISDQSMAVARKILRQATSHKAH